MIEDSDCDSNPCPDRAMCRNDPGPGNFTCLCRSGYTGDNCETTIDPCNSNPCANDATCKSFEQNRFFCEVSVDDFERVKDGQKIRELFQIIEPGVSWEINV